MKTLSLEMRSKTSREFDAMTSAWDWLAQWDSDTVARSYEIHTSPDPMTATSLVAQPSVTKSSIAMLGLT
jgi:hypothetical protein